MTAPPHQPPRWNHPPVKTFFPHAIGGIVTLVLGCWAVTVAVGTHHVLATATIASWAILCGTLTGGAVLQAMRIRRNSIRTHTDSVTIRPPLFLDVNARLMFASLFLAGALTTVTWLQHGVAWTDIVGRETPHSHNIQAGRFIIGAWLAVGLGTISMPFWLSPHLMNGTLTLSPRGIQCRRPLRSFTINWDDIAEITNHYKEGRRNTIQPIVFRLTNGRQKVYALAQFADDAADLYAMIINYHQHPERRTELTNDRAAQRLRTHDFTQNQ